MGPRLRHGASKRQTTRSSRRLQATPSRQPAKPTVLLRLSIVGGWLVLTIEGRVDTWWGGSSPISSVAGRPPGVGSARRHVHGCSRARDDRGDAAPSRRSGRLRSPGRALATGTATAGADGFGRGLPLFDSVEQAVWTPVPIGDDAAEPDPSLMVSPRAGGRLRPSVRFAGSSSGVSWGVSCLLRQPPAATYRSRAHE